MQKLSKLVGILCSCCKSKSIDSSWWTESQKIANWLSFCLISLFFKDYSLSSQILTRLVKENLWSYWMKITYIRMIQMPFMFPGNVVPFGAQTLLVGWQEGHPACKTQGNLVRWWWYFDRSFARFITPIVTTSSITLSSNKIHNGVILVPANLGSTWKMALKTERYVLHITRPTALKGWLARHCQTERKETDFALSVDNGLLSLNVSSCRHPGHHRERSSESRSRIFLPSTHWTLSLSALHCRPQCSRPVLSATGLLYYYYYYYGQPNQISQETKHRKNTVHKIAEHNQSGRSEKDTKHKWTRWHREQTEPGWVALCDIRPGNGRLGLAIVPWHMRPPSTNTGAPWPLRFFFDK